MKVSFFSILLLFPIFAVNIARAQTAGKPVLKPGLALTLSAGDKTDTRFARVASIYVPGGGFVSPFLPSEPFVAKWEGNLISPLRADYTFSADALGKFTVNINGESVLEGNGKIEGKPVQLKKGVNKLVIDYTSPPSGDAMFRLLWASKDFPAEPIQPGSFSHDTNLTAFRIGEQARTGRLLFAQLHCTACHEGSGLLPSKDDPNAMPELAQDAPSFGEYGARYNEAWLAKWINDPHAIRPHTQMPRIFTSGPKDQIDPRAADLAAFLVSMGERNDTPPDPKLVAAGGALFANLGCIACHTKPDTTGEDEYDRVPLRHVREKWQAPALREYLKNPQQFYQWTRMPNFGLSNDETAKLTAYLFTAPVSGDHGPKGDATKGAALLVTAGCLNCHAGTPPSGPPKLAETVETGWVRGCMAPDDVARGNAPNFALTEDQREALSAFAKAGFGSLKHDSPIEFSHRQTANLRCAACHPKDGKSNIWSQLDNEIAPLTAAAPTSEGEGHPHPGTAAPIFTWFGEKLHPEWAAKFIAGEISYKPRPWMIARMPAFATYATHLAQGISMDEGYSLQPEAPSAPDPEKAKVGSILIGENGGFNCTACHGLGSRPATAVFEAPGINLAHAHERLRHEYYHRWVNFPLRIDPETKMPRFADDTGTTPLPDYFDGSASEQFEAIWQYIGTVSPVK